MSPWILYQYISMSGKEDQCHGSQEVTPKVTGLKRSHSAVREDNLRLEKKEGLRSENILV